MKTSYQIIRITIKPLVFCVPFAPTNMYNKSNGGGEMDMCFRSQLTCFMALEALMKPTNQPLSGSTLVGRFNKKDVWWRRSLSATWLEPTAAPVAPVDCTLWSRTFIKNMDVMFFPMCDDLVYFFHMFDVYFLHMFDVYFLDMFESKD